ncbi:TetR/AcrR family transcriptional regulator [Paenibacillus lignilyticus]|uniref:TetR/AcrR family transcriptional regulator n=1 Tax=Paenibacillus lignilyticus TaxID=1172615 RepID=A0ABS5CAU9_9BACL|nr:TetR/AcrR family transcriptional regulator [Paenibacillus lignilyticus]MBP3963114.1 TetR/AcrR family transcriptional regulator [Paenibacillus lignilyticus]
MARTKEFDEDAVLLKAMLLFWDQGYEKTSMQDLVTHMGIHKGSLYDTFGDKQALYNRALKRYVELFEQSVKRPVKSRMAETHSAKEAIRMILEMAIQKQEEVPSGCFMVNTAVELAKQDAVSRDLVQLGWDTIEQFIHDIIAEGQQSGEISREHNARWLSHFYNNALTGLRVMIKTSSDNAKLTSIVDINMSVLD